MKKYIIELPKINIDEDLLEIKHIISTKNLDRYGTFIIPTGAQVENFLRNPKVLWYHNHDEAVDKIPIARTTKLEINNDEMVATTRFDRNNPFAVKVFNAYKDGYLSAWSIGFRPLDYIPVNAENVDELSKKYELNFTKKDLERVQKQYMWGIFVIHKWELLEYSAVPVGANQDALVLTEKGMEEMLTRGLVNDKNEIKSFYDMCVGQKCLFTKEDLEGKIEDKKETKKMVLKEIPDSLAEKLLSEKMIDTPEKFRWNAEMGYQFVNLILEDGSKVEKVLVLNTDKAVVDEGFDFSKVTDVELVTDEETSEEKEERTKWTTKYKNSLPDSAFAVIEPAYKEGKTDDKNARHLPHHKGAGDLGKSVSNANLDMSHYKNARARANQIKPITDSISESELQAKAVAHLERHHKLLLKEGKVKKSIEELESEMENKIKAVNGDLVELRLLISDIKEQNEKSIEESAKTVLALSEGLEKSAKEYEEKTKSYDEKIKSMEETINTLKAENEKLKEIVGTETLEGLRKLEENKGTGKGFFDKLY